MAPHSSTLAWKIPWTGGPGRLQSMGSPRVGHDWVTSLSLFTFMHGEGNGNPFQCSCLENPRDRGAWWAAVYGVAQSLTQLKRLSSSRLITWRECCYHLKNWKRQFATLENRNLKWKAVPSPPRALKRVTSDAETLLCVFSCLHCVFIAMRGLYFL